MERLNTVKKQWFLFSIVGCILLAYAAPWVGIKGGPLKPEFSVKYMAVFLIFLNSGLSLKTDELHSALLHLRLHVFVQVFTFFVIPATISVVVSLLSTWTPVNPWLIKGLLIVGCMPPPVSSAVIITKAIGGNEAAAIFNSALGSFLGIFVTPMLLYFAVNVSSNVPAMNIVMTLSVTVVLPLVIGQLLRRYIKDWMEKTKPPFGTVSACMLLLIIYTTFCDTFHSNVTGVSTLDIVCMAFVVLLLQLTFISVIFTITTKFDLGFSSLDVVAVMFSATHKSLTLGMPILKIIYGDYPYLPLISLPLLMYHPTQILLGGVLVSFVKDWLAGIKVRTAVKV